jgi:leucyl aminopeptidase
MQNTHLLNLLRCPNLENFTPGSLLSGDEIKLDPASTVVLFYTFEQYQVFISKTGPVSNLSDFADKDSPFFTFSNFAAEKGQHLWLFTNGKRTKGMSLRLLLVGLGSEQTFFSRNPECTAQRAFLEQVNVSVDLLIKNKSLRAAFVLDNIIPTFFKDSAQEMLKLIGKCLTQSNHFFDLYLSEKKPVLLQIDIILNAQSHTQPASLLDDSYQRGKLLGLCSVIAREIANTRADDMSPEAVAHYASVLVDSHACLSNDPDDARRPSLLVLDGDMIGSRFDSRLVAIRFQGQPAHDKFIVVVGKGVTYDTGGLNLKPTGSIENMHLDKGGAAAVLGIMKAVLSLRPNINVIGILGLAENAIGPLAYKPYSIIRSLSGKSVRVANTDAEGRLILADCLTFAQKEYNVSSIIDIATLTGSCAAALGESIAGVFSNNSSSSIQTVSEFVAAGNRSMEPLWPMPLLKEHVESLRCIDADLNSVGEKSRGGGASTAAAFLSEFVAQDIPWIHIDIAGPAMSSKKNYWLPEGGTGFGVQVVLQYLFSSATAAETK